MYWIDTADGHHCTRHDHTFKRGDVCHSCVTDPGDAPGGVTDDPAYQRELKARISEYRANARAAWGESKRLADEGTAQEGNLAVKWSAEAVKWSRLAEERQEVLDRRQHNLDLIRHEEAMSGLRRGN